VQRFFIGFSRGEERRLEARLHVVGPHLALAGPSAKLSLCLFRRIPQQQALCIAVDGPGAVTGFAVQRILLLKNLHVASSNAAVA
jgi:hypothetical protein